MSDRALHHDVDIRVVRAPAALAATSGNSGKVIDRANYGSLDFVIFYGTRTATSSTFTPTIMEGSATGTLTSAADADLVGTEALAALAATTPLTSGVAKNVAKKIGYIGSKRYVTVRMAATVTGATIVGVVAVLGSPRKPPIANP